MYLIVVVTLVIGLVGIYAQVLTVQAERFAASQSGLATTMIAWHTAAVSMAASVLDHPAASLHPPCSLSVFTPSAALPLCPPPTLSPGVTSAANGTVTGGAPSYAYNNIYNKFSGIEAVHLPPGYQTALYQFYSVLYRDASSNQPFVVTYVNPTTPTASNPAPSFLALASSFVVGFSMNDLMHQLSVSGLPAYAYGAVNNANNLVMTTATPATMPVLPSTGAAFIPQGSVGIVSSPAGF